MSRHLMARMRREATDGDDGWVNGMVLPHTQRDVNHFERLHGGSGSLPLHPSQFNTKIVHHGESRYGLQALDSTDGWSEWSLHRQTGPDSGDPDHWERMGTPDGRLLRQFCDCVGDTDEQHDLLLPLGGESGMAGYTGRVGVAKREAEEAFRDKVVGRGRGLGDYGDINELMRRFDAGEFDE